VHGALEDYAGQRATKCGIYLVETRATSEKIRLLVLGLDVDEDEDEGMREFVLILILARREIRIR
jgi:hypothetical protein